MKVPPQVSLVNLSNARSPHCKRPPRRMTIIIITLLLQTILTIIIIIIIMKSTKMQTLGSKFACLEFCKLGGLFQSGWYRTVISLNSVRINEVPL